MGGTKKYSSDYFILKFNIDADPLFSSEVFFFGTYLRPIRTSFFQSAMLIIGLSAPNLTENRCDKSGDLSDSLLGISPISAFLTFSFYHSVFSV